MRRALLMSGRLWIKLGESLAEATISLWVVELVDLFQMLMLGQLPLQPSKQNHRDSDFTTEAALEWQTTCKASLDINANDNIKLAFKA